MNEIQKLEAGIEALKQQFPFLNEGKHLVTNSKEQAFHALGYMTALLEIQRRK